MLRLIFVASLVTACTSGAPATTTAPPTATAPATPTIAAATASAVAVVTPIPTAAAPTVAPKTTDPYFNPDDKYTPRPSAPAATDAPPDEPGLEPVVVEASEDGSYLVGPDGMTLYTFDEDADNQSNCNGGCAAAWPPLGAEEGQGAEGGDGVDGDFTVFHRDDESHQVAYDGEPLYYYAADQQPGDTLGDGVNGTWHLAVP